MSFFNLIYQNLIYIIRIFDIHNPPSYGGVVYLKTPRFQAVAE